jgi:hypothetical protein
MADHEFRIALGACDEAEHTKTLYLRSAKYNDQR